MSRFHGRSCHALPEFYSTLGSCCFCLLTDFTIGLFRIMSEHIVIATWLGTDDSFLTLGVFCQSISTRVGDNRGKFVVTEVFFYLSLTVTSSVKFPLADENSMDGAGFLFGNGNHGDEVFDDAFDDILTF